MRAALEAVALQVADVLEALPSPVGVLRADGGASSNTFLMQLQADLVGCPVEVSAEPETTALGAAAGGARPRDVAGHGERREAPPARKAL